jgi:hypothetical protein
VPSHFVHRPINLATMCAEFTTDLCWKSVLQWTRRNSHRLLLQPSCFRINCKQYLLSPRCPHLGTFKSHHTCSSATFWSHLILIKLITCLNVTSLVFRFQFWWKLLQTMDKTMGICLLSKPERYFWSLPRDSRILHKPRCHRISNDTVHTELHLDTDFR